MMWPYGTADRTVTVVFGDGISALVGKITERSLLEDSFILVGKSAGSSGSDARTYVIPTASIKYVMIHEEDAANG